MKASLALLALALPAAAAFAEELKPVKAERFEKGRTGAPAASGRPLDLGGLLGPQVPGPSAGPPERSVEKELVLAAVDELSGPSRAAALARWRPLFEPLRAGGRSVEFSETQIQDAARILRGLVADGKIQVKSLNDAAGAWTPEIVGGKLVGGVFEIGPWRAVREPGRRSSSFPRLKRQDQYANTLLHEAAHMFYSAFRFGFGFRLKDAGELSDAQKREATAFASHHFWNSVSPATLCGADGSCPYTHSKPPCRDVTCYYWEFPAGGHALDANEHAARVIAQDACGPDACRAYARVLEPVFR